MGRYFNNFKTNNLITKRKKLKVRMNKRYKSNSSINVGMIRRIMYIKKIPHKCDEK
jgi:hypothetical protein